MLMDMTSKSATPPEKAKQINTRLTAAQERLLRQHCVRERVTVQEVVVDALARALDGFDGK